MKLMLSWTTCLDHEVSELLGNMQEECHLLVGKDCCLWGSENSVASIPMDCKPPTCGAPFPE